jgi:HTH-type transcriptional regulator / antitoxin HipB
MQIRSSEALGQVIRSVRKAQALTQIQLAAACGLGTRFIIDLESGKPTCQLEKALLVTKMLGIHLEANSRSLPLEDPEDEFFGDE